jgi:hypothetical protein
VREGQTREWVREKDRERRERGGRERVEWEGGGKNQKERSTFKPSPPKALTFSVAS